jgi:hypothetical protein
MNKVDIDKTLQDFYDYFDNLSQKEIDQMTIDSLYQSLATLDFTPWFTPSNYGILPDKEGIIVSYNPILNKYIPSYTNSINTRYFQLLEEPNTEAMSKFCYVLIDGYENRLDFREKLRSIFRLDEWK